MHRNESRIEINDERLFLTNYKREILRIRKVIGSNSSALNDAVKYEISPTYYVFAVFSRIDLIDSSRDESFVGQQKIFF